MREHPNLTISTWNNAGVDDPTGAGKGRKAQERVLGSLPAKVQEAQRAEQEAQEQEEGLHSLPAGADSAEGAHEFIFFSFFFG
jgi:hypothetical protein